MRACLRTDACSEVWTAAFKILVIQSLMHLVGTLYFHKHRQRKRFEGEKNQHLERIAPWLNSPLDSALWRPVTDNQWVNNCTFPPPPIKRMLPGPKWWCMPLILAVGEAKAGRRVSEFKCGLHGQFQVSQGYLVKRFLKNQTKRKLPYLIFFFTFFHDRVLL